MPTTSAAAAPSTRPILTTKNPTTTTTTSSFIETISASHVDGSTQTSIIPSVTNSTTHNPILGDPSLDGAYKFIGIILIYSIVFLICFIIFAILSCRAIRTQTKPCQDPAIKLNRLTKRQGSIDSLEDDNYSSNSFTSRYSITRPAPSKQLRRNASIQEIQCHAANTMPGFNEENRDSDTIHMYCRTNSSRNPSPPPRSSSDITASSFRGDRRPPNGPHRPKGPNLPKVPKRPTEQNLNNTHAKPTKLLSDGVHEYTIREHPDVPSLCSDIDEDRDARHQG